MAGGVGVNILDQIFLEKRAEVAARGDLADVRARAADAGPVRDFAGALHSANVPALIAEVKKGSPSRGVIREDFDVAEIATAYARAGATCLSVLTDVKFFHGAPENLAIAREASGLPALRKDFTTHEFHVYEARALQADAILLIVNGLNDGELRGLRELAEDLGMAAIVEAHSEQEADRALASGAKLLGINNRDLQTFQTTTDIGMRVIPQFADRVYTIAESALKSREDVQNMCSAGARAVLIGTAFCERPDLGLAVRTIMGWNH